MSMNLRIAAATSALSLSLAAQSLSFTDICTGATSSSERDLIRAAYDFVHAHRVDLFTEIDRGRDAGRYGYEAVSATRIERWLNEIGSVTINCENDMCASNPGLLGHCGMAAIGFGTINPWDRTRVCVTNCQTMAASGQSSVFALIAGTIAHEVMHQCDGWEGHGNSATTPANPRTDAETVGVAMEHLVLTPDLNPAITTVQQKVDLAGAAYLEVVVTVANENPWSGSAATVALSGNYRNQYSQLAVELDGRVVKTGWLVPLAASASTTYTFAISQADGFSPTRANVAVEVTADYTDVLFEYDENDNTATTTYSPSCDLAISRFEIAGPYTRVSTALFTYRRVSFLLGVTNQSSKNAAVPTVVRQVATRCGAGGLVSTVTTDLTLAALAPLATATFTVTADVRETDGQIVVPGSLLLVVDPDAAILDSIRSNNQVSLTLDASWFRPDYTIWFDSIALSEDLGVLATFTVKNVGPETGDGCWAAFSAFGRTVYHSIAPGLTPAASETFQSEIGEVAPLFSDISLAVEIDVTGWVVENNESNNHASAWIRNTIDASSLQVVRDLLAPMDLLTDVAVWIDPDIYGQIEQQLRLATTFLSTHSYLPYTSSGPFIPPATTCVLATQTTDLLCSLVQWKRVPIVPTYAAAGMGTVYEALRLTGIRGPAGQTTWRP